MSESGDSVKVKVNRRGHGRGRKLMIPERDSNSTSDGVEVSTLKSPKVSGFRKTLRGQRSPQAQTRTMVTATAELYEAGDGSSAEDDIVAPFHSSYTNSPQATPLSSISTASDVSANRSKTESPISKSISTGKERRRSNWTSRVPADTPERVCVTSEDESLRSLESAAKEKSPVDEYLAITVNSTPSYSKVKVTAEDQGQGQEPEEISKKVKAKPSLLKKWTKKMAGSFTKSSQEKEDIDVEKFSEEVDHVRRSEVASVMTVEDEVKKSRSKVKKKKKTETKSSELKIQQAETIQKSKVPSESPIQTGIPEVVAKQTEKQLIPPKVIEPTKTRKSKSKNDKSETLKSESEDAAPILALPPTISVLASPSAKRNLRRREKAGEFDQNEKILGIKIHHTDLLPTDPNITHPVVRITVMTPEGHYPVRSSCQGQGHSEPTLTKNCVQQIMTSPSLLSGSGLYRLLPKWEEMVVVAEPLQKFLNSDDPLILFFEIMDFVPMGHESLQRPSRKQQDLGWHKIGWAFLKPLGVHGTRHVNRKLRLQLYRPDFSRGQNVFAWWRSKRWSKLNSTLYVTLKSILPPEPEHKSPKFSLSTLLSMKKGELTEALIEGQLAQGQGQKSQEVTRKQGPQWKRFPGQSCKVPNKLLKSLPASDIDSLNFRVMGNVQCVKFSPCGTLLGAGLDTERYHVVLIFEIPSGKLLKSLRGHHGLIYELDWSCISENCYTIGSASADSTVRIWKLELEEIEIGVKPIAILLHPTYVYTLEFSPTVPSFLATGCYDSVIRIWKLQNTIEREDVNIEQSAPIFLLNGHRSYINSVRFHPNGQVLFSGDGKGTLCQWQLSKGKHRQPPKLEKETKLVSLGHGAITSLCLDSSGRKILVQLSQTCLKILDIETFLVLNSFQGVANERYRLQSVLSPCGNLVLSGSENSALLIWDADTGRLLSQIHPADHPNCVVSSVTYHPFDHYVVIGLLSTKEEPQPILLYTFEYPPGFSIGTISKMRKAFSSSTKSTESERQVEVKGQSEVRGQSDQKRSDISLKFQSILQKLDQVTGGTPQLATVTAQVMEENRLLHGN